MIPYVSFRFFIKPVEWPTTLDSFIFYSAKIGSQILIVLYAIRKIRKTEIFNLKNEVNLPFNSNLIFGILGGLSLIFLMEPLERVFPATNSLQEHFGNLIKLKFGSLICVVLLSPILNELIFRSVILRGLLKNYNPGYSILLVSVLFAIFHLNLLQVVVSFCLSLFISFVYWQTRSLGLSILVHVINNGMAYLVILLTGQITSLESRINNTAIYLTLYLIAAMVLSSSLLQIYKKEWMKR